MEMSVRYVRTALRRALSAGVAFALMVAGCATTPEQTATSPGKYEPPAEDVRACEGLATPANAEAAEIAGRVVAGVLLAPVVIGIAILDPRGTLGSLFRETGREDVNTRKERARVAARANFIGACLEVLKAERSFGTDDARLIAPLIAFGDAHVGAAALPQAEAVYRRAGTIAERNGIHLQDGPVGEVALWDSIKTSNDPRDFGKYLDRFPFGRYSALAQSRYQELIPHPAWRILEEGCLGLSNGPPAKYGEVVKYPDGLMFECQSNGSWLRVYK